MRSLGFGLEKMGLAALRAPTLAAIGCIGICIAAVATLPNLKFDGSITSIISHNSPAALTFSGIRDDFRDFHADVMIILQAPNLTTAARMEDVRALHLDLTLEDPVESVLSVFSFSTPDPGTGKLVARLPQSFESDDAVEDAVARLLTAEPIARSFYSGSDNAVALLVTLRDSKDKTTADVFIELERVVRELLPAGFEVTYAGLPTIQLAVKNAVIADQINLTLIGMLLGTLVAYFVFGSLLSALICALPPLIATLWVLALFSITGTQINHLLTVLPSLAMILAFADSIVLYFYWKRSLANGDDALLNLRRAITTVGPASAMTSITTALAFASFATNDSEVMKQFGWLGAASVLTGFLAFIWTVPLLCHWTRPGPGGRGRSRLPALTRVGPLATKYFVRAPITLATAGVGLIALFWIAHSQVETEYRLTEYLPKASLVHGSEFNAGKLFGGSGRLFAVLTVPPGSTFSSASVRKTLRQVHDVFANLVGPQRVGSLANLWREASEEDIPALAHEISSNDVMMVRNVLSRDHRRLLITVAVDALQPSPQTHQMIDTFRRELRQIGLADAVTFSGFPVLAADEMPKLVERLRTGLLIAVFLAIGVIMVASGSIVLGLACLIPNLIPILSVESLLWVTGNTHDVTTVIALTIAFGIAIDNAIHVINFYRNACAQGMDPPQALSHAVGDVAPALLASTLILCVSLLVTQFSAMPTVVLLGRLMIATLMIALVSNLLFLPSYIRLLTRLMERVRGRIN
jgi:predicted RND superfamily exporter protein